ncbi:hypothetical protein GGD83_002853 [Rhodoblastus sphagnicola]|nr:phage tail assembly protein [Rhodoblastus sphagnicola]MBB4199042.1 hypothetical protein [Rhodoblastus sphagnicola]
MSEETMGGAAADEPKIVDFDAGETFDGETVALKRPFKLKGVTYKQVALRIPTGADYERSTRKDAKLDTFGLLTAFTGLPIEALQKMASVDAKALDVALGKLLWG